MIFKIVDDLECIDLRQFLSSYKFNPVRGYRIFNNEQLLEYSYCNLKNVLLGQNAFCLACFEKGNIVGVCVLADASFETTYFEQKSARIDSIIVSDNLGYKNALKIKQSLIDHVFLVCRERRIRFLTCRIDVEDVVSCNVLEENGFKLMDTILNFLYSRKEKLASKIRNQFDVGVFEEKDRESLVRLVGKNFIMNRFYNDPHINKEKAIGVYEFWIKNFKLTEGESEILVAKKNSEVCGFIAYELNRILYAATKIRSFGHSLTWVDRDARGAFVQLLGESLKRKDALQGDFSEANVHIWNHPIIRVLQYYGYRLFGSNYTFHRWVSS